VDGASVALASSSPAVVAMSRELDDETERGEYERMRHTPTQKLRNLARVREAREALRCPAPALMEALIRRKDESHGGAEEVPDELRERATRIAEEARRDPVTAPGRWPGSASSWASIPRRCATG
jgi:hypothetical protein